MRDENVFFSKEKIPSWKGGMQGEERMCFHCNCLQRYIVKPWGNEHSGTTGEQQRNGKSYEEW